MFGPMLVMSLMSLFLLIPRHGGGYVPKGNWIRRPRRGLPCWTAYHSYSLYRPFLQLLLALRVSPAPFMSPAYFFDVAPLTTFFGHLFWHSFHTPFFSVFGANLAPTWPPTWTQNPPNIAPRAIQNPSKISSCFWCPLGLIFGGFLVQLGIQNHSDIHPKLNPKASQQANNENSKMYRKPIVFC